MTIPGASLFRVAANSIKTWEKDYAKYIKRLMIIAILSSLRSKKVQPQ